MDGCRSVLCSLGNTAAAAAVDPLVAAAALACAHQQDVELNGVPSALMLLLTCA